MYAIQSSAFCCLKTIVILKLEKAPILLHFGLHLPTLGSTGVIVGLDEYLIFKQVSKLHYVVLNIEEALIKDKFPAQDMVLPNFMTHTFLLSVEFGARINLLHSGPLAPVSLIVVLLHTIIRR